MTLLSFNGKSLESKLWNKNWIPKSTYITHLLAVWPWVIHLTPLILDFCIALKTHT